MKSWVGCVLISGAAVWSGCMAHVPLPEAPTTAPYPVRVRAYNTFRPISMQYTTTVSYGRYGVTGVNTAATGLMLANGTNVFYPEDLVPLAGANSPTAAAAREHESANNTADILLWSGLGASAVGMGLFAWGLLGGFNRSGSSGFGVPLMITGGVFSLGGSITVLVGSGFRGHAGRQREAAYQLYDQSLRQNLGLCGDGSQVGDCAPSTGGDGAVPPPPPPPNAGVNVTVGTPVVVPLGAR